VAPDVGRGGEMTCEQPEYHPSAATREVHRSRPRPRESLFVANWVGIGSMCSLRIAPALRVGDAFRADFALRITQG
jgi:hypothetical protein